MSQGDVGKGQGDLRPLDCLEGQRDEEGESQQSDYTWGETLHIGSRVTGVSRQPLGCIYVITRLLEKDHF